MGLLCVASFSGIHSVGLISHLSFFDQMYEKHNVRDGVTRREAEVVRFHKSWHAA
jgi:hypothetical protein